MEIKDILAFERIEAQELVGHLDILEKFYKDSNLTTKLELFKMDSPYIEEALRRNHLYRCKASNSKTGIVHPDRLKLYKQIKNNVIPDSTVYLKRISIPDAVGYRLHFGCLIVPDDSSYAANFPDNPFLYIFNTKEILYNLVLDDYVLPKNVQNALEISQGCVIKKSKNEIRDVMMQVTAHFLFSTENKNLRWDQKKVSEHFLVHKLGLDLNLSLKGGRRALRDASREIIPMELLKRGSPKLKKLNDEELNREPLIIPNVICFDRDNQKTINFRYLKIVLRTLFWIKKILTPKGQPISEEDFFKVPVLRQLLEHLSIGERSICIYELKLYSRKFNQLEMYFS